ncbi:MAG: metallophosphoesterase family protein [Sulfolobales archaeon]
MRIIYAVDIHGDETALKKLNKISNNLNVDLMILGGDIDAELLLLKESSYKVSIIPGECDDIYITKQARELGILFDGTTLNVGNYRIGFIGGLSAHQSIRKFYERVKENVDILVTHFPPKGCLDLVMSKFHGGLHELNSIIAKYKVKYVLTGHYHDNVGSCTLENAIVINPGPLNFGNFLFLEYNEALTNYEFRKLP